MSKSTRFAAILGMSLLAFATAPDARAASIFGFGNAETVSSFAPTHCRRHRAACRHHRRVRLALSPLSDAGEARHPLLSVASRYLGAGKVTRMSGPWCRDFINLVASRAGYRLANHSRRAIDALALGRHVSAPHPGDLVVMRHHVTIFAGFGGRGVLGLGGNQGHRVKMSSYPARRVLAFVRL